MDFNFPLILFCLVAFGAAIWIVDSLFFAKNRPDDEKDPFLVDNAKQLTPILALVFVLRSFLYEPFQIPSGSMEETLLVGDFILVNKFTYGVRLPILRNKVMDVSDPSRGDVMVFFPPNENRYYIKRVVGTPGDVIDYKNKVLTINGKEQTQELKEGISKRDLFLQYWEQLGERRHQIKTHKTADHEHRYAIKFPYKVPEGHYFMMGDNRDNSTDSRFFGPVHESRIVGQAVAVWMHKEPGLNLPTFSRAGAIQ